MNTIPIDDFAQAVKSSLLKFILSKVIAVEPIAGIIGIPIIGSIALTAIEWILNIALTQAGLAAFIINTKVFTQDQAKDYMAALEKINAAPDDIPDADWEKLENEANNAFSNLISFTA